MLARQLRRIAGMDLVELGWRGRVFARNTIDRVIVSNGASSWERRRLESALVPELASVRAALAANMWLEAHRRLADHFMTAAPRFLIGEAFRATLTSTILERFPASAVDACQRAERILAGDYDLLGYRGLRFDHAAGAIDWHVDPVHNRRAVTEFWTSVPYLDPACGDHKIIWELNRHQHWAALGRAFWLTGDMRYRERSIAECVSWLEANPPLLGINWASMLELGLRSVSWIWALHFLLRGAHEDEVPWIVDLLLALDRQLRQIEHNLSYYFSPNTHLLGEALALYVSGRVLPELAASDRRQTMGRRLLIEEIARQVLPDGGHCERSTHYHRYALDFYNLALAVAIATGDPASAAFEDAVTRLARAARVLADDEGRLPRIGDDDGGSLFPMAGRPTDDIRDSLAVAAALTKRPELQIGSVPEEAFWMLGHPALVPALSSLRQNGAARESATLHSTALPDTGYYVSRSARGDHLVVDGGAHGFRNGGHAHADALSMTLTVRGTPLLIDAGTGCYTIDPARRNLMRSTALHNTLVVDGRPQSIPEGPFSWSTRAEGRVDRWISTAEFDYFEGSHDGYAPLEHRRHILIVPGDFVVVADLIRGGAGVHTAAVHWHIDRRWMVVAHPRLVSIENAGERCQLAVPHGSLERFEADAATGLGWHAPSYGLIEPAVTVRVTHAERTPFWVFSVFGLCASNPVVSAIELPVRPKSGRLAHAAALRIARQTSTELLVLAEPLDAVTWLAGDFETGDRAVLLRSAYGSSGRALTLAGVPSITSRM
jgi:Heparinase II/III-like protein/Heparinase II/III N-terminus